MIFFLFLIFKKSWKIPFSYDAFQPHWTANWNSPKVERGWSHWMYRQRFRSSRSLTFDAKTLTVSKTLLAPLFIGSWIVNMCVKRENFERSTFSTSQIKPITSKRWSRHLLSQFQRNHFRLSNRNWFQVGSPSTKSICHIFAIINRKSSRIQTKSTAISKWMSQLMVRNPNISLVLS